MRGRGGPAEPQFGSDSFLDIVANLVGILIILIMLAGLQAARAPVSDAELIAAGHTPLPAAPEPAAPSPPAEPPDIQIPEPAPRPEDPVPDGPTGPTAQEIAEAIENTRRKASALSGKLAAADLSSSDAQLRIIQQELSQQSERLSELQQQYRSTRTRAGSSSQQLATLDAEYEKLRSRLVDANRQLETLSQAAPPTESLELRINPIARRVSGPEIAFRVDGGRVLHMPIDDLVRQVNSREKYSTMSILKGETQRGRVGPIEGVTLTYELRSAAVSDGSGTVRIQPQLAGIISIENDAPDEPVDQALSEGGILSRILLAAPRDAVIRLFVATDSFQTARRVSSAIRDLGLPVDTQVIDPDSDIPVVFGRSSAVAQ